MIMIYIVGRQVLVTPQKLTFMFITYTNVCPRWGSNPQPTVNNNDNNFDYHQYSTSQIIYQNLIINNLIRWLIKRTRIETYLVILETASQTAAAGVGRRSAAASTMPLHHRDGHHSRVAPPHLHQNITTYRLATLNPTKYTTQSQIPDHLRLLLAIRYRYERVRFQIYLTQGVMQYSLRVAWLRNS